jgi:hypothetical protein
MDADCISHRSGFLILGTYVPGSILVARFWEQLVLDFAKQVEFLIFRSKWFLVPANDNYHF